MQTRIPINAQLNRAFGAFALTSVGLESSGHNTETLSGSSRHAPLPSWSIDRGLQSSTFREQSNDFFFWSINLCDRCYAIGCCDICKKQAPSTIWRPDHGIVFGNTTSPLVHLQTLSTSTIERDLADHSQSEDSYVLASPAISVVASTKSSSDSSDGEWIPSSTPSGQTSPRNTENPIEGTDKAQVVDEIDDDVDQIHPPLTFQIPAADLEAAKQAGADTSDSFWSHKSYVGPDNQKVKVHYCKSKHTTERVLQTYFQDKEVLGFDIEWKPEASKKMGIKKNVALIQLASEDRIALFHIALFAKEGLEDLVAPSLRRIMEDPDVTKVGVSIKADCTRLRTFMNIDSRGIFELSHLYKLVKYSGSENAKMINKKLVSLASQVQEHLGLPLYKGEVVRGSDWAQALNMDQIAYAASDSYAGFMLYDVLEARRKQLRPTPPRPYHAELNLPIRLISGDTIPTIDEAAEAEPSEAPAKGKTFCSSTTVPLIADENIEVEQDSKPTVVPEKPRSVLDAETWAKDYRSANPVPVKAGSKPPLYCTPAVLRTYALWRNDPTLETSDIAKLLRHPPLQESTVRNYIIESVRVEHLPYDKERLRKLFENMPDEAKELYRYKALWNAVAH